MNEDAKKNLRTQGKYGDKVHNKSREKRPKESPTSKEPSGKKTEASKRSSNGTGQSLFSDSDISPVKYEENSRHSFDQLEVVKKPIEIREAGETEISKTVNGVSSILYEPDFISYDEGNEMYNELLDKTDWYEKNLVIRGEEYPQPRLVAWYGPFPYSYSGVMLEAAEMPEIVLQIKDRIEQYLESKNISVTLNSVLLNYYRDGQDSVAWHSDDELTMGVCPTIVSISLGETRKFEMKRNVDSYPEEVDGNHVDRYFVNLTHGSLLVMNGVMQTDWQHRVPKEYHHKDGRINLTFRTVYSLDKVPAGTSFKEHKRKLAGNSSSNKAPAETAFFKGEDFPPLGAISPVADPDAEISQNPSLNSDSSMQAFEDTDKSSMEYFDATSDLNPQPVEQHISEPDLDMNVDVPNKSIDANDNLSNDEVMNVDDTNDKTEILHHTSETSPVASTLPNSKIPPFSNSNLNVDAQPFVPVNPVALTNYQDNYEAMDLFDLSLIETENMNDEEFFKYMDILKDNAMKRIHEFTRNEKDELAFIIELIDKSPCLIARRLAGERIRIIVKWSYERYYSMNYRKTSKCQGGYPRQEHYSGNQRNYSSSSRGKRYSNKEDIPRYNTRRERRTSEESTSRSEGYSSRQDDQVRRGKTMSYSGARQANREKAFSSHSSECKDENIKTENSG